MALTDDGMNDLGADDVGAAGATEAQRKAKKKQQIEIVALAVLLIVFVYLLAVTFFKPPQKKAVVTEPVVTEKMVQAPEPFMAPVAVNAPQVKAAVEPSAELKEWGDNPFVVRQAKTEPGPGGGALQLQGIVLEGEEKPYAVINDRIVTVGDRVADEAVQEIRKGKVILVNKEGKETVLEG